MQTATGTASYSYCCKFSTVTSTYGLCHFIFDQLGASIK
jgi:hypothetical protein